MAVEFTPAKVGFDRLDVTIIDTKFGVKPFGWVSPDGYGIDGTVIVGYTRVSAEDFEAIIAKIKELQSSSK
jgi:hypothetical protein